MLLYISFTQNYSSSKSCYSVACYWDQVLKWAIYDHHDVSSLYLQLRVSLPFGCYLPFHTALTFEYMHLEGKHFTIFMYVSWYVTPRLHNGVFCCLSCYLASNLYCPIFHTFSGLNRQIPSLWKIVYFQFR